MDALKGFAEKAMHGGSSSSTGNNNAAAGTTNTNAGAGAGQQDYLDKGASIAHAPMTATCTCLRTNLGVAAAEKKFGFSQSAQTNEKVS